MWPFDDIGSAIGNAISDLFDSAMTAIWNAGLDLLRVAFNLADQFSVFTVSTTSGPVKVLWPMMLWISGVLALALFFWQIIMTNLQAGRGFLRLVGGPFQYGIALAVTVGVVAVFIAGIDGLTNGILDYGLQSSNFTGAFSHTGIADSLSHGVKAVVLGLCAIGGLLPSAVGYVLEMLFREAAIYVMVAVIPIVAAGLLANVTASWFWRTARWLAAAIAMKPVLAMTLVLGVAIAGGSQGVAGLMAGIGVLEISLTAPFVLFRLFAFMDPTSDAGAALRDFFSGLGVDSYGSNNPVMIMTRSMSSGEIESANTSRFDQALAEGTDDSTDHRDSPSCGDVASGSASPRPASSAGLEGDGKGENPPPPEPPDDLQGGPQPGGGAGGPHSGPTGGAAAGEAGEAAAIL